jgi:hypothetical protein
MVPRHPPHEIACDGKRRKHGAERGQRCEEEASGPFGVLADREEPLHQAVLTGRTYCRFVTKRSSKRKRVVQTVARQDVPRPFFAAARFSLRFSLSDFWACFFWTLFGFEAPFI